MDRDSVLRHQTVLVTNGRIAAIGSVDRVTVPAGATRIDGRGKFLMPGLADMHAHIFPGPHTANGGLASHLSAPDADSAGAATRLFMWLANGVTTLRNLDYFNDDWAKQTLRLRARAAAGESWIPRIYTAGKWGPSNYLYGSSEPPDPKPVLDSIPIYVAAYKAAGYDLIKVHNEDSLTLIALTAAAKRIGMPVVGHVPPPWRVERAIASGYTSIEHPFTDYVWGPRTMPFSHDTSGFGVLAGALARAHVWHCPTQSHYAWLHNDPPNLLKVEQDSGVKLLIGTDEIPWVGAIASELQAFVDGGLTPYQALLAGTRNVAEYFGTLNEGGTVTKGKRADLILLTGNPLEDVRYAAQPAGVMIGGRWLSREEIDRRVAGLMLPTLDRDKGDVKLMPVKSYWGNIVEQTYMQAVSVLAGVELSDTARTKITAGRPARLARQQALIDSLGTSTQYVAGTRRVLSLMAQQLGEFRAVLSTGPQAEFDRNAKAWMARRTKEGYAVSIPGVQ